MMKKLDKGRTAAMACEGGFEALQSMLKGEYTEESTGARTIRQTGGKDRHSKVFTARGPRDRRVRLSVATAIRFYDLQDRLGFEQPSKAVEWLLLNCQPSIQGLPQLASLHPVRVASALSQPAAYVAHNHNKGKEPSKDEHITTHQQKEEILDAVMHPNGEQDFHQYNYIPAHHPFSLHNGLFPLSSEDPLQDSIEEDLSQYSNPSSSGGSSDHPISFSEGGRAQDTRVTLAEALPITANHTASLASMHGQCSTSFAPSPGHATVHVSKRHRMQQSMQDIQERDARFASSGSNMIGKSLAFNNGQLSCSSFGDAPGFNRLVINDDDAFLMSKFSLQSHLQNHEDMQQAMKLPSLAASYKANQYVDITQQFFAAQAASQLADNILIQGAACNGSNREADYIKGTQVRTSNTSNMNDTMQLYNKIAFQQVDELVCSNMYASPSPSESTSMNPLSAAYSKAGGNINNNNTFDDQKLVATANILYNRPSSWNPASGQQ